MGRKPKPDHRKYSERTVFMSLPSERERYDRAAELSDRDLSEWIRETLNAEAERLIAQNTPVKTLPKKKRPIE